jgi:hypothetical protein
MGLSHVPPDELAAWVAASCAEQGIPVRISDPLVVRQVAVLMGRSAGGSRARPRSARPAPADEQASVSPDRLNPANVQAPSPAHTRSDHHMVEDCPDDGLLSRQLQRAPLGRQRGAVARQTR